MNWIFGWIGNSIASLWKWYYTPAIEPKYKKKPIPRKLRIEVWRNEFGDSFKGQCYACGCNLDYANIWHASHIIAERHGGQLSASNLRPCCVHCNTSMGTMNLYTYIIKHNLKGKGRKDARGNISIDTNTQAGGRKRV